MSTNCWLNGRVVHAAAATISPFDRGFLYGDGLFETMRVERGRVHLFRRHLLRLYGSARILRLHVPDAGEIQRAIDELLHTDEVDSAIVRLTVSRGVGGTPLHPAADVRPTVLITHRSPPFGGDRAPIEFRLKTVSAVVAPAPGPIRLKSLSYLSSVLAGLQLPDDPATEALMCGIDGSVAEGAMSNVFMVRGRTILTPPLELGVLPGVTRQRVLELAESTGFETRTDRFTRAELAAADECFITNAARGIATVTHFDGALIGDGGVGPVTAQLHAEYRREVPAEWSIDYDGAA